MCEGSGSRQAEEGVLPASQQQGGDTKCSSGKKEIGAVGKQFA